MKTMEFLLGAALDLYIEQNYIKWNEISKY